MRTGHLRRGSIPTNTAVCGYRYEEANEDDDNYIFFVAAYVRVPDLMDNWCPVCAGSVSSLEFLNHTDL